ncbi:nucleobase, nucleoside, nucleotide kinase-like protein [Thermochaetoides thermophila DSM 1495]|uniref:Nucleobase, nucleoside, nucleotide kinase-like protein n=1 Tax=Chaetomium thermophilum (strain DSM 1495 / CBS 144.50 / IMI 039719) TaxID=759272 RepID=G0SEA6_CHATD|nr:nucleobase, nucleoside, nucleotide kinase-like protein [Thermochaetoides thermophila DSM 1495]EGS18283.1 nucleobase, nucleoside, nucleotide kinase-like protein [Thermochaetoides thermophila DSM 1495]
MATMDTKLNQLVDTVWARFQEWPGTKRFLIVIGGIPGSGKTTLSLHLTAALNARWSSEHFGSPPIAVFVPMDGFHYTRAQLDTFPNPAEAHARRGAAFTFDGEGFVNLVKRLAEPVTESTETIWAPDFDHAAKDPRENAIAVERHNRIVVLEGNYTLLNIPPWSQIAPLSSLTILATVPHEVARRRLAARHLRAGIVDTLEAGDRRAVENDLPNGDEMLANVVPGVDVLFESVDEEGWGS